MTRGAVEAQKVPSDNPAVLSAASGFLCQWGPGPEALRVGPPCQRWGCAVCPAVGCLGEKARSPGGRVLDSGETPPPHLCSRGKACRLAGLLRGSVSSVRAV